MSRETGNPHIGYYAIVFGVLYWAIETLIHVYIFSEGQFFELFFKPEANEAWMRLLISVSFIAFGVHTNRTIKRQQELNQKLHQQRNQLRRVIDSALDGYIAIDTNGIITDWNPSAEKMFGWSRKDAIGTSLLETIVPQRFQQAHQHGMKTYLSDGSGSWLYRTVTTTAKDINGHEFSVEMAIIPIISGDEQSFYAFIRRTGGSDEQ